MWWFWLCLVFAIKSVNSLIFAYICLKEMYWSPGLVLLIDFTHWSVHTQNVTTDFGREILYVCEILLELKQNGFPGSRPKIKWRPSPFAEKMRPLNRLCCHPDSRQLNCTVEINIRRSQWTPLTWTSSFYAGPVHTNTSSFLNASFSMRFRLPLH